MSYKVETTDSFKKEAKSLIKKYKTLKPELAKLADTLSETPQTGTHLGNNVYKIRLAVKSKNEQN